MNILPTECECKECSLMCHAPCCGTHEEMQILIDNGYASRLMYDDLPGGPPMLKPALKGYEGKRSPWSTATEEGCTFWKDGKCELHSLRIKPIQGKLAHHSLTDKQFDSISDYIKENWENVTLEELDTLISKWNERKINEEVDSL